MSKNLKNIDNNAFCVSLNKIIKFELSSDCVKKKSKPIFEYYDKNHDGILQKDEISELKNDVEYHNKIDGDEGYLSDLEAQALLNKILPGKKADIKALNELFSTLMSNYYSIKEKINTVADGKIDDFEQGVDAENCWLLSQLRGLSNTTWGRKAIKDSIQKNKGTKSYTIRLSGVNFETQITNDEIRNARKSTKYSDGDLDVLLIELAVEKYLKQEVVNGHLIRNEDVLSTGTGTGPESIQYMLTGKQGHSFFLIKTTREEQKKIIEEKCNTNEKFKSSLKLSQDTISNAYDIETMKNLLYKISNLKEDVSIQCSFAKPDKWNNAEMYKKLNQDEEFENSSEHCFNIEKVVTDENGRIVDIILTNPWNTEFEIHKTLDEFLDKILGIYLTRENDNYDDLTEGFLPCVVKIE